MQTIVSDWLVCIIVTSIRPFIICCWMHTLLFIKFWVQYNYCRPIYGYILEPLLSSKIWQNTQIGSSGNGPNNNIMSIKRNFTSIWKKLYPQNIILEARFQTSVQYQKNVCREQKMFPNTERPVFLHYWTNWEKTTSPSWAKVTAI